MNSTNSVYVSGRIVSIMENKTRSEEGIRMMKMRILVQKIELEGGVYCVNSRLDAPQSVDLVNLLVDIPSYEEKGILSTFKQGHLIRLQVAAHGIERSERAPHGEIYTHQKMGIPVMCLKAVIRSKALLSAAMAEVHKKDAPEISAYEAMSLLTMPEGTAPLPRNAKVGRPRRKVIPV